MAAGLVNITIKDGGGVSRTFQYMSDDGTVTGVLTPPPITVSNINSNGRAAAAASTGVALSTEDFAVIDGLEALLTTISGNVDGLEGFVDGLETLLTAISGKLPASLGTKAASASQSVTAAGLEYETVAASQTDQVLGATGATGDYLSHIIIQPTTTAAGTVTVKDNTTVIFTFTTGTLADLRSIIVPFGLFSVSGAWKVTTGANVAVIGAGDFT